MKLLNIATAILLAVATTAMAADPQDGLKPTAPSARQPQRPTPYIPSAENLQARRQFADAKFGIFIHWGIYSMFGQGEWYLQNCGMPHSEYAKAAQGFYPARFNAQEWVSAIKDSGAKYITITSRHHDGFSMFHTAQSTYNIVDATPFGRDPLKELADECQRQGIQLNFYYSHIDWTRDDYPAGRTGLHTGKDPAKADWPAYYAFMNAQLHELLTGYGRIGAIWFDGLWDHDSDSIPFNWQLHQQYDLIHSLQPQCLVANNHHCNIIEGEDIQLFERDLPGQNNAGYSDQDISATLPFETCQTMNGSWGYRAVDLNYKDTPTLIRLIVGAAGRGANLLLNIGPQPSGALPDAALSRLKEIGAWMRQNGETIYATTAGHIPPQPWGCTTHRPGKTWLHIIAPDSLPRNSTSQLILTVADPGTTSAPTLRSTGQPLPFTRKNGLLTISVPHLSSNPDIIIELTHR